MKILSRLTPSIWKNHFLGYRASILLINSIINTINKEDLAPSLQVVAIDSISGGVEAYIYSKFPILGIQWHTDRKSPDPKFNKELISMFLMAKSWNKHHEN